MDLLVLDGEHPVVRRHLAEMLAQRLVFGFLGALAERARPV
jgi:hypothetical protein